MSKPRPLKSLDRLPRRILQLAGGLALFGIGVSLILKSNLGAASWDVLTQGLSHHLPLSFGTITIIMSGIVLLCWIPLRQRVGFGTVANAILIGVFADVGLALFPSPEIFWVRIAVMLLGVLLVGIASGIYIGAGFGSGPRDGLMIGLHEVTRLPIWVVRTALEVFVVVVGWLLGGTVGIGTLAFAVFIGPLCQVFLPLFAITDPEAPTATKPAPAPAAPEAAAPEAAGV
ncbi:MAG: YczE/YyaS/YitT family protein [Leucobacter sp.]